MAGGYWESQNKVRPGAYVNFETNDLAESGLDSTGPVVIPLMLDWGVPGKFIAVSVRSKFTELFGKSLKELIPIREAFKANGQVIVYNLNGTGEKATATSGTLVATAIHGGKDGNNISVTITVGLKGSSTVRTFYKGVQVDSQVVATVAELVPNAFASFSGELPTEDASLTLTGGTTVAATNESYSTLAEGLDTQDFKVVAIGTADETIKQLFTLKVKEWREQSGKNVTFVTNNYKEADFEGVVSVLNGVTLEGNEALSADKSLYFYAGAYANAGTNSLTYVEYPGAIDCERKTHEEIVQALKDGHIVYVSNNGRVVVEQDINTFRSFTVDKNRDFRKNKLVRTMDSVSDNVQHVFSTFFIGRVNNNEDGRDLFKQQVMKVVLDPLVQQGALEYTSEDISITQGDEKDSVLVGLSATFNDAMEKLYMTVHCQ
ncbi:phage tail sheath C-terminal domain-containing protein [Lederbergia wuyishanensis]|uniref:Phage tail sheath protein n=1 Tax=Lederbergia wuyishanensis TaxID=1347903 RepID=A0ABU0D734_9BACI|nr:phage tail sheath C-terminal domain-containing protein [Lederbergia wuyishanensis]MCJ8008901.1 phage tail sheath family protein [Lederbergia wuyishanensis]MDQ0344226.1 hypothetical protein [Lederbergia wuyishanensis]